jgi:hypothetical protein
MRPVAEEMLEIEPAGLTRAADQRRRPGLLMKGLVPDLAEMPRRRPTGADAGIGAVEEEEREEPLGMLARQALRGIGADVMGDDAGAGQAEPVEQRQQIRGMDIGARFGGRTARRLVAVAEAAQIGRNDIEVARQIRDAFAPDATEFRPSVQQ